MQQWQPPRGVAGAMILGLTLASPAFAGEAKHMEDVIPSLYTEDGVPGVQLQLGGHQPHFTEGALVELNRLNEDITSTLGLLALNSTVSGYTFDMELGVPVRNTESFGPILSERAETLGQNRLNVGCQASRADFRKFEGENIDSLDVVLPHLDNPPPGIGNPPYEVDNVLVDIDLKITQEVYACYATYGILRNLDFGIAVPAVRVSMSADATAVIERNYFLSSTVHNFDPTGASGDSPNSSSSKHAFGLGDVVARLKYNFVQDHGWLPGMGALLQVKTPTGDSKNFLGTGDTRVRLLGIASRSYGIVSPHINLGWEWVSGGNREDNIRYIGGFDFRLHPKITFVTDIVGSYAYSSSAPGKSIVDGAFGVKVNPWRELIIAFNALVPLNKDTGLRPDWVPTLGVEYSFGGPE